MGVLLGVVCITFGVCSLFFRVYSKKFLNQSIQTMDFVTTNGS